MLKRKLAMILAISMTLSSVGIATLADTSKGQKIEANKLEEAKKIEYNKKDGTVKEVNKDEKGNVKSIFIMPNSSTNKYDGVVVKINEDTKLKDQNDLPILANEIKEGMQVEAIYSKIATKSAIPQSNGYSLKVTTHKDNDVIRATGEVKSVRESIVGGKLIAISKEGNKDGSIDFELNLNGNTIVIDENGKKLSVEDIKVGMKIDGYRELRETRSIPPQSNSIKLVVKEDHSLKMEGKIGRINTGINGTKYVDLIKGGTKNVTDGGVRLIISDKTEIVDENGIPVEFDELKSDMEIEAIYSKIQTRSIPPQSNAYKIVVKDENKVESQDFRGIIKEIYNGKDVTYVTISDELGHHGQIRLVVGKETKITDKNGKKINITDLKNGMTIEGKHSLAMTFSIPPQTAAFEIKIVDLNSEVDQEKVEFNGKILSVDKGYNGNYEIFIERADDEQIILLASSDTKVTDAKGRIIKISDLEKGMKISGYHSLIMQPSFPGKTVVYEIKVEKIKNDNDCDEDDDDKNNSKKYEIEGIITEVDDDEIEVNVNGKKYEVEITSKTKIVGVDHKKGLKEGQKVKIECLSDDDDDEAIAIKIVIVGNGNKK